MRPRLLQNLRKCSSGRGIAGARSEEHTSELQSRSDLVCRLLLEKKKSTNGQALRITALEPEHKAVGMAIARGSWLTNSRNSRMSMKEAQTHVGRNHTEIMTVSSS